MPRQPPQFERPATTPLDFIAQHEAFRVEEFEAAYRAMRRKPSSARAALAYHVNNKRLVAVRRGVYAHLSGVDPWLLATKLTPDAVLSHDGALSVRGLGPLGHSLSFLTTLRTTPTQYNEVIYRPLRVSPRELHLEIDTLYRLGQPVLVTSLERTLVDCLARLDRAPPLEALLDLFLATERETSASKMISWASSFKSPLLVSRLAFFLQCGRRELDLADVQQLNKHSLTVPDYFLRSARSARDSLVGRWNLIVSPELQARWPGR